MIQLLAFLFGLGAIIYLGCRQDLDNYEQDLALWEAEDKLHAKVMLLSDHQSRPRGYEKLLLQVEEHHQNKPQPPSWAYWLKEPNS